jgi:hypothetical protein
MSLLLPKKSRLTRRAMLAGLGASIIVPKARAGLLINPYAFGGSVMNVLNDAGLLTNLKCALDAGDVRSAPSGSTQWLDLSGGGFDFDLGTTGGADTTDPTFNGTPGGLSANEYWSLDGGDYFEYEAANATWMENLHKDNALFSFIYWVFMPNDASQNALGGTGGAGGGRTGVSLYLNTAMVPFFEADNAGTSLIGGPLSGVNAAPASTWAFVGFSFDEAAGTGFFSVNSTIQTFSKTYASPGVGAASNPLTIATRGGASSFDPNAARYGIFVAHEGRALTQAEMDAVYQATRVRFGV